LQRCSRRFLPGLTLGLLSAMFVALPQIAAASPDRVVLLSWDGVRRDYLYQMINWQPASEAPVECPHYRHDVVMPTMCNGHWTCMPNLCQFQMIDSSWVEGSSLTSPQHAQMLSGYGPIETGAIFNATASSLPAGMSIYEHIRAVRPEIATVHIADKKFVGNKIVGKAKRNDALDVSMGRGGYDNFTGSTTAKRFVEQMAKVADRPFFIFTHFKTVDWIGHRASDQNVSYKEAIIQNDIQLGTVLGALDELGLSDVDVYITTDHGFGGIFHNNPEKESIRDTWFASRHPVLTGDPATILDVVPTIMATFGISPALAVPPYRGHSLLVP